MDEAISIIKQERPNRIDYHTPINEWKKLASAAGFLTHEAFPTVYFGEVPGMFVMEFFAEENEFQESLR